MSDMVEGKNTLRSMVVRVLKGEWYPIASIACLVWLLIDNHGKPVVTQVEPPTWMYVGFFVVMAAMLAVIVLGWFRLREWGGHIGRLSRLGWEEGRWVRADNLIALLREWGSKPLFDGTGAQVDARAANRAWAEMLGNLAAHIENLPSHDKNGETHTVPVELKINYTRTTQKAN